MFLYLKKIFFLPFIIVFNHATLHAQESFSASVSPSIIGKNESAELKFTISNATHVESIVAPSLKDFTILSGPNQESSMQIINGATTQSNSVTYIIQPKAIGTFNILPGTAQADGKIFHSNNLTIKVTKKPQGNSAAQTNPFASPFAGMPDFNEPQEQTYNDCILKKGENIQDKINKNIFVKAEVDKTSCFVGEPVVVTYKLYSRLQAESNITKSPSFNGFSVIDLQAQDNAGPHTEKLNGREYNVYTLLKSQLYPLQSGQIELGTVATDNTIHFIKETYAQQQMNNAFGSFMQTTIPPEDLVNQQATLESKPITISVKPLPDENKPFSFKQAVGNFEITDMLDKSIFSTDDAGKLTITIIGSGNMTLLNSPDVSWQQGIESFEPKTADNFDKLQVPITGSKSFIYSFTAEKPGNYVLPPVEFSYFDPKTATYKTTSTKPIPLSIMKGAGKHITPTQKAAVADTVGFSNLLFDYRLWVIIIAIAFISTGLLIWVKKENKNERRDVTLNYDIAAASFEKTPQPKNYLATAEIKLLEQDSKAFYKALNEGLCNFLAGYFHITSEEINKKRIAEEIDKKGIAIVTGLKLQQLMDDIEWQLYTPFYEQDKMQKHLEDAMSLIRSLSNSQT